MTQRRQFIHTAGLAFLSTAGGRAAERHDLIESVAKEVLSAPPVKKGTWFHPRACRMQNGEVLMTLQPIQGSDFFGHVHYITTKDQGRSWSEFKPIPSLGWEPMAEGGHDAVCDVTPEFHPQTGSVLALGHNVIYKTDRFHKDQPPRWPVYAVYKDGQWGPKKKLVWDDPRGSYIYSNNCGQRHATPSGDVMMSFTFGVKGQP
jgi:hypothetical protein